MSWFVCWIHINNVVTWLHKGFLETCAVTLFVGPVSVSFHSHRILLICVGAFSPCDGFLSQHALLFTRPGWSASWPSSLFQDLVLGFFCYTLIKWSNTLIFRHSLHVAGWTNSLRSAQPGFSNVLRTFLRFWGKSEECSDSWEHLNLNEEDQATEGRI